MNLPLTLSQEYGVDDNAAARIMSSFFSKLVLNDTVTPEIADEIFALTIRQGLANTDKRKMAEVIFLICQKNTQNNAWVGQTSKMKLRNLEQQLFGFAQGLELL